MYILSLTVANVDPYCERHWTTYWLASSRHWETHWPDVAQWDWDRFNWTNQTKQLCLNHWWFLKHCFLSWFCGTTLINRLMGSCTLISLILWPDCSWRKAQHPKQHPNDALILHSLHLGSAVNRLICDAIPDAFRRLSVRQKLKLVWANCFPAPKTLDIDQIDADTDQRWSTLNLAQFFL